MRITVYGESIECTRVIKGPDFMEIHAMTDGLEVIRKDSGITDFSGYVLEGGEYESPPPDKDAFIDGMMEVFADE